jgi:DNA mismatch repair protein MutS
MSDDATPLMRQYREVKQAYQDAIVLFRVGDFYEMFHEDAEVASRLLAIALTTRDKAKADPVPLCGVPYHAATTYIAKLLKAGRTVAVCDQVEDPKLAKGLVRREVTRVFTPGTLVDAELLPSRESNVVAAVAVAEDVAGLAALEPSTGEFWVLECSGAAARSALADELTRLDPRELLLPNDLPSEWRDAVDRARECGSVLRDRPWFDPLRTERLLKEQFKVASLDGFGCRGLQPALQAAGAALRYVRETQPSAPLAHITRLRVRRLEESMQLDAATIRNLELVKPLVESRRDSTLLATIDRTATAGGSRLLREWLIRPLCDAAAISARLDAVQELHDALDRRTSVREFLKSIQDLARLTSRIALNTASPRDLVALKQTLAVLPVLRQALGQPAAGMLRTLVAQWDDLADLHGLIESAVNDEVPANLRDGGVIRDGHHAGLDELRKACREGKTWIAELEAEERVKTGIETLKVRFNQVFGYYIEVTKTHQSRVPDRYTRKQTLVNAERYTTPELKELEDRVTGADLKIVALEQELFDAVRQELAEHIVRLQAMASAVAHLDVFAGLAETAAVHRYTRPDIDAGELIRITEGRHPVVERLSDTPFVPNDTLLNLDTDRLLILTGPNMAGKSTYLRQIALIVLLGQIGSFVPARHARIGIADRIFTRVGASDNLAEGHSTFMVEMLETAHILNCASPRSLILLDEIGRGTSTYDGLSIAWAVAEHIQDRARLGARTLFATHYHEMTELAAVCEGVKNYTVAVRERNDEVLFLRKIVPGGADRSYGIHVARLAGFPPAVLNRAREVLARLEQPSTAAQPAAALSTPGPEPAAPLPRGHHLLEEVRQMDLFGMTPLEALNRLADLQRRLQGPDAETPS